MVMKQPLHRGTDKTSLLKMRLKNRFQTQSDNKNNG